MTDTGATHWSQGCVAAHLYGRTAALAQAAAIAVPAHRQAFLAGVNGLPKYTVTKALPPAQAVIWTDDMIATLKRLRAQNVAIFWCAQEIGVAYGTAVHKCRDLGLANRRNSGRTPGTSRAKKDIP